MNLISGTPFPKIGISSNGNNDHYRWRDARSCTIGHQECPQSAHPQLRIIGPSAVEKTTFEATTFKGSDETIKMQQARNCARCGTIWGILLMCNENNSGIRAREKNILK